jgi:hypothetical protein
MTQRDKQNYEDVFGEKIESGEVGADEALRESTRMDEDDLAFHERLAMKRDWDDVPEDVREEEVEMIDKEIAQDPEVPWSR